MRKMRDRQRAYNFGAGELHNNTQDCLDHVQDHRSVTGITYVKKNKRKDKKLLLFLRPGLNVIDSNGRAKKKAWCAWYAPRILCQCVSMRMEEADEIRGKGLGFGCMSISPTQLPSLDEKKYLLALSFVCGLVGMATPENRWYSNTGTDIKLQA